ncbi:hypothetical protein AB0O34_21425 [Sphaerisporangium sp. NPDC088356]|uniref:hypothetical protein n=1 Tax=Sphaerisporangium sp. NPDC088356 TaxID=3154871 RepID=UPI0034316278
MSTTGLKPFDEVVGRSYQQATGLADPSAQSPKAQRGMTIRRILHGLVPRAGYASRPAAQLEATLRHEMGHATGIMALYAATQQTGISVGWIIAGSMRSWIAISAWWAVTAGMGWMNELICDAIALRATSATACIDGLKATKRATRIPWKNRPFNWLYRIVWYTSPPLLLRIAALQVGALFEPRDRRPVTACSSQDPRC